MSELVLRSQPKQKTIAALMTALVLFLIFLLLKSNSIPRRDLVAEHYDSIDWMEYIPKPKEIVKPEEPQAKKEPEAKPKLPEPSIKRIDLDAFANKPNLSNLDLKPQDLKSKKGNSKTSKDIRIDIDESTMDDFNLAFNDNSTLISPGGISGSAKGTGEIELQAGSDGDPTDLQLGSLDKRISAGLGGPEAAGKNGSSGLVEVGLKNLPDFGESFEDFSPIYKPLVEWMKLHPAELPPVVKKFMGYSDGDLASYVRFEMQNISYEMFLLCIEKTYEVHVALLSDLHVTYLIDQGFRKKSNLLRVGRVDRFQDHEILNFGTNLQPAGSQIAREFYQIFLSWWESVKHEVE